MSAQEALSGKPVLFAVLGQRKLHRSDLQPTQAHNSREIEVDNAEAGGPAPIVAFGRGDIVRAVPERLRELAIEPRREAVWAIEFMMTTTEEWWPTDWRNNMDVTRIQMGAFERMAMKYVRGRFPPEALISAIWHLDEQVPHLHWVVLPIRQRVDQRFNDRRVRWTLSARGDQLPKMAKEDRPVALAALWRGGIGGKGLMALEQTRFAEVMAPLGLVRGKEQSRTPNKSNREFRAEMAAAIAAATAEREGVGRERDALAEERAAFEAEKAKAKADREAEREKDRQALEARFNAERARIAQEQAALDERSRNALEWEKGFKVREKTLASQAVAFLGARDVIAAARNFRSDIDEMTRNVLVEQIDLATRSSPELSDLFCAARASRQAGRG